MKFLRLITATVIAGTLAFSLSACSPEKVNVESATAIIDVRTPAEFSEGHLSGAINIDIQSDDFDEKLSELDSEGEYIIYCRSGRRSALAKERMATLSFNKVSDLGSLESAAAATGLSVVQ